MDPAFSPYKDSHTRGLKVAARLAEWPFATGVLPPQMLKKNHASY